MACPEYTRLSELSESKRRAYAYIRLNEGKVQFSKQHYEALVREGYAAMTAAMKDVAWHKLKCSACNNQPIK
jgi:hypothetical protein